MPTAKSIVAFGLGDVAGRETDAECLPIHIEHLVGHGGPNLATDEDQQEFNDYVYGAYALGIAIGQLVSPRLFKREGK